MSTKITELTPEQKARFGEWVKKWIGIGLSTEPADFDAATDAALRAYKLCGLPKPTVVLRMGSPYAAAVGGALALGVLRELGKQRSSKLSPQVLSQVRSQVRSQVGSQVLSQVGSQVWSQVGSQVWSQVLSQVGSQVLSQVGSQVLSQVESQVWSQVGSQVDSQVRSQVWSQVRSQVLSQVLSQVEAGLNNHRGGQFWAGWGAYISFFRDVCGWENDALGRFEIDETLIKSCGEVWWHENVLAISDRPREIRRDEQGRLHNTTGPAIRYPDGWAVYAIRGVRIPGEWITTRKPSAKEALTWPNVEQRRAACELLGWANVLSELKARVIDEDADPEIGTLLECDIPDSGNERFLKVRCGTGRSFVLPVDPKCKTAREASAWTYGLEADLKRYQVEVRT